MLVKFGREKAFSQHFYDIKLGSDPCVKLQMQLGHHGIAVAAPATAVGAAHTNGTSPCTTTTTNDGAVVESSDNTHGGCCHSSGNTTTPEVNTSGVVAPLPSLGQWYCPNDGAVVAVLDGDSTHQCGGCCHNGGDTATPEVSTSDVVVSPPVTTARLRPASNQAQSSS
ncbi:hypothetical protein K439DRAFT_1622966 [Ramaria rubella]|nr:hypothetical protein K439DRAFT_1622966 [Ramaria rubella]